jgi:Mce-associated membrane protein
VLEVTAKTGKDVAEDAEAAAEEPEARPAARPARKKVRRVRVIEVIDDGEDGDDDLSDVLEALDEEEADPPASAGPKAKPAPEPAPAKAESATDEEEPEAGGKAEPEPAKAKVKPKPKPAAAKAGRSGTPLVLTVVAVVLIAALATVTVLLWSSRHELAQKEDARREVTKVVTDYGNVVLGYDRADLRGSVARAQSFLTGDALTKSKQTDVAQLQKSMDEGQFTLTSKTSQVYVASADGRFASAVLVFDISVKSPSGTQDVTRNYLSLSLVFQDGKWKISQQKPAGRESDGAGTGGVPGLNGGQAPKEPKKSGKPKE